MANKYKPVTHCIFDMDGLLLDTEKLYTIATQRILNMYGDQVYTWEFKLTLMGMVHADVCRKIVEHYKLPITPQEYSKLQRKINSEIMIDAELMPDTESVNEAIMSEIAQAYNKPYPIEVRLKLLGTTEMRSAEILVSELSLPITPDEFLHQFRKQCREKYVSCDLFPGAERLLRHLHKHKIPFCVATSSSEDMVEIKITKHRELFKLLNHRVCASSDPEVKQGKPAPDIFLIAASRFPDKPEPSKCLVFEDAPNGVQAARSAGMQAVMVPDPRVPSEMTEQATQKLRSLEDFKPELFGLPPFQK